MAFERLPGFRDFYPEPVPHPEVASADVRRYIFETWRRVAQRYGFREYDGPPLEPLELYTAKSGAEIVAQLYHFTDKGGREVALRPEMTPTLARLVAAHQRAYKKPMKWFAIPQLFRYERQQKGRLREHFQFNADLIGESAPAADAELIALLVDILRAFGLGEQDFVVRLSSRNAWREFYARAGGRPEREYDFFQVIDKLEREPAEASAAKLQALGFSLPSVQEFIRSGQPSPELQQILDNLAARGLQQFVQVDYAVIRGLAYYTGPVFEAFDRRGEFRAIAGGGRYDNLIQLLSGGKVHLPALGFGMGDVVLSELLKARGLSPACDDHPDIYCLIEDETLRAPSLALVQKLRDAGRRVEYALTAARSDKQLKLALELRARHLVTLQRSAAGTLQARWRNLATREERLLSADQLPAD